MEILELSTLNQAQLIYIIIEQQKALDECTSALKQCTSTLTKVQAILPVIRQSTDQEYNAIDSLINAALKSGN